jgi:drug/metabolite transporter (DMT)-like permease
VLCAQALGVVLLVLLALLLAPSFAGVDIGVALGLIGSGLLGLLGYLAFYRALEHGGAVGLVSAISATYGGVTTVLAVAALGEHLGIGGAIGVVLAVAGIALAAARPAARGDDSPGGAGAGRTASETSVAIGEPVVGVAPAPSRIRALSRAGVPLAIISALGYGIGGFLLGKYSGRAGWLVSALVAHGASITVMLIAFPLLRRRMVWRGNSYGVLWAGAAGLTDAVGLLAFSQGGAAGQVAVTAAVSSVYPVIPLVGGVLLFSEHLTRRQVIGVGGIIAGLVLIGLG